MKPLVTRHSSLVAACAAALAAFAASALDFSQVAAVTIPEGAVESISTLDGEVLWQRTPTARDYVQDGLVAMWDGIENAGWGVHDAEATVWKDLIGNRDWTLGTSTSYEWTANSFDAKDQFAATQDFIDGSFVTTVEVCAKIKTPSSGVIGNFAFVIIGRIPTTNSKPYYGLLYRNSNNYYALMGGRSYYAGTASEFAGVAASFSFPNYATMSVSGYFNGTPRGTSENNTLDYNSETRGTVARIGGTAQQSMPVEVYNIRLYSRALTAEEIAANYAIDRKRFGIQ